MEVAQWCDRQFSLSGPVPGLLEDGTAGGGRGPPPLDCSAHHHLCEYLLGPLQKMGNLIPDLTPTPTPTLPSCSPT